MQRLKKKSLDSIEQFAIQATERVGSTSSLLIHTALFMAAFTSYFMGANLNAILLIVTTLVSLEAIYLSIFIQMSVNRQTNELREVSKDIEEIQEDVEEIQEDVEGIEKDVEEIQEDVEEIQEDDAEEEIRDPSLVRIENILSELSREIKELKEKK